MLSDRIKEEGQAIFLIDDFIDEVADKIALREIVHIVEVYQF